MASALHISDKARSSIAVVDEKLRSVGGVSAGRFIGNLSEFAAVALAARILGPAEFGKFSYILAVAVISGQLFDLGTARILTVRTSLLIGARANSEDVGRIYGSLFGLRLALGAILLPVLIWMGFTTRWSQLAAGLALGFLISVVLCLSAVFQSQLQFARYASSVYLPSVLRIVAIILLAASSHGSLHNLIIFYVAAHSVAILVLLCLIPRAKVHLRSPLNAKADLFNLFHFGKWLMAAAICEVVYLKTDVFALRFLSTPQDLGIYAAAFVFAGVFNLIFSSVVAYYIPVMCRAAGEKRMDRLKGYFLQSADLAALIGIPTAIGVWAVGPTLFPLVFGDQFRASAEVWPILAIYSVCVVINQTGAVFFALEKLHIISWVTLGILISNVFFCSLLVPRYGAFGAAWAVAIGQVFSLIVCCLATYRLIGAIPNLVRMGRYLVFSLLFFPLVRAVSLQNPKLNLGIKVFVGIVTYAVLLVLSRKNLAPFTRMDPEYGD